MTINCYQKKVWSLQCKYSELVEKYLNGLLLGTASSKLLECLKTFKRGLSVLNRYDTRDVVAQTTDYNVVTYATILSILETLTNKY